MQQLTTKLLRVLGVSAVVLLVVSACAAQGSFNKDRRLRVKRGSTVIARGLIGGEAQDRYTVRVAAGQEMIVTIHSAENRADFSVCDEDQDAVCGSGEVMATGGRRWTKRAPRTGDYYIFVTAHPESARYTLRVTLKR